MTWEWEYGFSGSGSASPTVALVPVGKLVLVHTRHRVNFTGIHRNGNRAISWVPSVNERVIELSFKKPTSMPFHHLNGTGNLLQLRRQRVP